MSALVLYLVITIVGFFIGSQCKKKNIELKGLGLIQTLAIVALVFFMGGKIGADEEILQSLDTIGLISFAITIFILAGSVIATLVTRKLLGFNKVGDRTRGQSIDHLKGSDAERMRGNEGSESDDEGDQQKTDYSMTVIIVCAVAAGILAGHFILPAGFLDIAGTLITIGLCVLLFFVGLDIGTAGTIAKNFKQAGWRVFVFPFVIIAGTLIGSVAASLVLPVSLKEALCVGSGMGWYSLAPAMLADYSVKVSAISFMHNVIRELLSILLMPIIAKQVGYIETFSMPGAAAMDVCLPIVEKATKPDIAVYSFISGVIVSIAVPILVSSMMGI